MNRPADNKNNERACVECRALLNDYIDERLSARSLWDFELHLAACRNCASLTHQMQATVEMLGNLAQHDTAPDFMSKLHAQLDAVEPGAARAAGPMSRLRDWMAEARDAFRPRRLPTLGLGVALAGLAALLLISPQPNSDTPVGVIVGSPTTAMTAEPLSRNVALAANNPFDDPTAANLQATAPDATSGEGDGSVD